MYCNAIERCEDRGNYVHVFIARLHLPVLGPTSSCIVWESFVDSHAYIVDDLRMGAYGTHPLVAAWHDSGLIKRQYLLTSRVTTMQFCWSMYHDYYLTQKMASIFRILQTDATMPSTQFSRWICDVLRLYNGLGSVRQSCVQPQYNATAAHNGLEIPVEI